MANTAGILSNSLYKLAVIIYAKKYFVTAINSKQRSLKSLRLAGRSRALVCPISKRKTEKSELNTFDLPIHLFYKLAVDENWETLQLTLRDATLNPDQQPCCMVFSYKTPTAYIPMIIGLDYTHNPEFRNTTRRPYINCSYVQKNSEKKKFC